MIFETCEITGNLLVTTKQGRFTMFEDDSGGLDILGVEVADAKKHTTALDVRPFSSNYVSIHFRGRE